MDQQPNHNPFPGQTHQLISDHPDAVLDDLLAALEFLMRTRPEAVAPLLVHAYQLRVHAIQQRAMREVRAMKSENIAHPAPWRMLTTGSAVWAPFGAHGWRAAIILALGKNRASNTVVHLAFNKGGHGRRTAGQLYWRKPELNGKDKPSQKPLEVVR